MPHQGDRSASWIVWQMSMGVNLSSASDCLFASGKSFDLSHASVSPCAGGVGETLQCWAALTQFAMVDTSTVIKRGFHPRCSCYAAEWSHLHSAAFLSLTCHGRLWMTPWFILGGDVQKDNCC